MDKSINKYIAETGFCSRREADKYIEQGRVTINDNIASKGNRVEEGDIVEVDGEPLKKKKAPVYIALNKPKGITCTTDLKDKSNIIDYVNYKSRVFPIGRLDKLSEGLIFLTNDGDIVNKILRAGNGHEKEYMVSVDKPVNLEFLKQMRSGVRILGEYTKPCFVQQEGPNRFRIILTQGLNRQIRRMCEALGYKVESLKRTRIMGMSVKDLAPGHWRHFTKDEIAQINDMVAKSSKTGDKDLGGMDE
jgi:23S rRNA pseudouridine2604 synthase